MRQAPALEFFFGPVKSNLEACPCGSRHARKGGRVFIPVITVAMVPATRGVELNCSWGRPFSLNGIFGAQL